MAKTNSGAMVLAQLVFWAVWSTFVAGKVSGMLAAWSWWWLLMPLPPVIAHTLGWA